MRSLLRCFLRAEWEDGNKADWDLVGELAGRTPDSCRSIAKRWEWPAGPLIQRGNRWDWVAWPYAFRRLAEHIDSRVAERFIELAITVLSERDPALDMSPEDRWLENVRGKVTRNSSAVRSGLAKFASLMAIHGHLMQGGNGQGCADRIVRTTLCVDSDALAERWLSVTPLLDELAEAAPGIFLDCSRALANNQEALLEVFKEGGFLGRSPHTYLLWGIEKLAWSADYLTPAVELLGVLSEKDPGGQLSNRPINSLGEILLIWHPNTTALLQERLDAIDALYVGYPDIAWKVGETLFSGRKTFSSPTSKPRWRDWAEDWRAPTRGEIWEYRDALADRLVAWADGSAQRWAELAASFGKLKGNAELQSKLIAGLGDVDPESLSEGERMVMADALRGVVNRHRTHSNAEWALGEEELEPLSVLIERFEPVNPVCRNLWLFGRFPDIPEHAGLEIKEQFEKLRELRRAVMQEIASAASLEGILQIADKADNPSDVGLALADVQLENGIEMDFLHSTLELECTEFEMPNRLQAAWQYVAQMYARRGGEWLHRVSTDSRLSSSPVCLLNIGLALPPSGETWDIIREWGDEVEQAYWQQTTVAVVRDPEQNADRAIRSLLHAGRPYRALELACLAEHELGTEGAAPRYVDPSLLVDILRSLAMHTAQEERFPPDMSSIPYYVERLFGLLDATSVDQVTIIQLEFALLPVLEGSDRGPRQLLEAVKSSAWVFVELLKMAYRGEGEAEKKLSEHEQSAARLAYRLLSNLRTVPGTQWTKQPEDDGLKSRFDGDISFPVGEVDAEVLDEWVREARVLSSESGRLKICDEKIGELLAYSTASEGGGWPSDTVKQLIERVESEPLERGLGVGLFNKRGVHFRPCGGELEWKIARRFSALSQLARSKWPRTAALLRDMAAEFEQCARQEDEEGLRDEFQ